MRSHPFDAIRSQSEYPLAQLATAHCPATHAARALSNRHRRLHPPQCSSLVVTSTSHPLGACRSQSPKPGSHVPTRQVPAAQYPLARERAQTVPHAPQFMLSLRMSVSHPFDETRSQSRVGP
jgi:hypothetical protein